MKKKIILLAFALMLFAGIVSASSINGDYKGMPIVKITSGDRVLETDEVPGFIYEGHTVVPISTLRQLGASVTWDAYGYSVDVKMPQNTSDGSMPDLNKLSSLLIDEVAYVQFTAMSIDNFTQLSFSLKFDAGDTSQLSKYQKVLETVGTPIGINQIRLEDKSLNGYIRFIKTQNMKDFKANKINLEEFNRRMEVYPKSGDLFPRTTVTPDPPQQQQLQNPETQPTKNDSNNQNYTLNDAVLELGFPSSANITVDARSLAIELVEIRKTKKQSDYSIQDALLELGIPQGARPTLATLRQAVKLISIH